ncbi:hypothetical protein [Actinobaculum sp. 352]|uniref:hypothetical protein n=1 Tax=Actinobaculum sp. 352 TaxID=2490946 RepID=UPI0013DFE8E9|nr:hypothetical protein [Actinobaculum sp. 352]
MIERIFTGLAWVTVAALVAVGMAALYESQGDWQLALVGVACLAAAFVPAIIADREEAR